MVNAQSVADGELHQFDICQCQSQGQQGLLLCIVPATTGAVHHTSDLRRINLLAGQSSGTPGI